MPTRPPGSLERAIGIAFPARRIYVRTDERTQYIAIGPKAQLASALAIAALLGWTGFTTSAYVTRAMDGHATRARLETMREAYEAKLAANDTQQRQLEEELNQANQRRDQVTERLSDKQARLVDTANSLQEAEAELAALRGKVETMVSARRADADRIASLEQQANQLHVSLARSETAKSNLTGAFETLGDAMDRVISERDHATTEETRLGGEVGRLSGELARRQDHEERVLSQLEDAARVSFTGLEGIFSRSNIDLDNILAQARRDYSGSGGPFEPLDADGSLAVDTTAGDTRVASLMKDLETVNLMRFAADRLPFGEPVTDFRETSGFGVRIDPKGRGRAMHTGVDLAAPKGTPIYATATGVVTFVGRESGYGIMVKIRHAFGFETVYAHLSRARVKVGQRVARGDRIADMGSTGRSTGSHLHYEVRIDNEPVNPSKFLEAARDVL